MLELCNIGKQYGNIKILDGINVKFENGIYGILGVNGAGKTTLMQIMIGLLLQDEGNVLYNGRDIREKKSKFKEKLGYMPQYAALYPDFTAEEFLKYICVLKKIPKKVQKERMEILLEKVNLKNERKKKIGAFSGGMKQRLSIAQAMLNEPEILILDEATAGLDPLERIRFRELVFDFCKDRTIIFATHITQDLEKIADQIILLGRGSILAKNSPENFLKEMKNSNLEEIFFYYGCDKC